MNKHLAILSLEYSYERVAFRVLFALLGIILCGYLYFVGASVLNIIARKEASRSSAALQSSIAILEKEYFVLSEAVTPGTGATLGLSQVQATDYVYRPGATASADGAASPDTIERNAI
jgi:hypothetical protein